MAARAFGALLAFVAASSFAVSLVTPKLWAEGPGWWDGHPTVDGKEIERKDTHIGLYGAVGCDTRGCQDIEVDSTFTTIAAVELSAIVLALLFAGMLSTATFKASERKKTFAALSIGSTSVVAIGAGVLLVVGVDIKSTQVVTVPIGLGMYVFWGGVVASSLASVIVLTERPEPLRLKPHLPPPPDAVHPPPVDVSEILRPSDRPSALVLAGAPGLGPPTADGVEQIRASHAAMQFAETQLPVQPQPLPIAPPPMASAVAGELVSKDGPRTAVIAAVPPPARAKPITVKPATDPGERAQRKTSDPVMMRPPIFESRVDPVADTVPAKPPSSAPAAFAETQIALGRTPPSHVEPPIDTERDPAHEHPAATPPTVRAGAMPPPRPSRPKVPMPGPIGRATPTTPPPPGKLQPFGGDSAVGTPPSIPPDSDGPATVTGPPPIAALPDIPPTRMLKPQRIVTDVDDRLESSLRETEAITAVEVDAEAKAHAKAERDAAALDAREREAEAREALDRAAAEEISLGSAVIVELDTDQQAALAADRAARALSESGDEDLPPTRLAPATRRAESQLPTRHMEAVSVPPADDEHARPTRLAHAIVLPPQARRDEEDVKPTAITPAIVLPRPRPNDQDGKPTVIASALKLAEDMPPTRMVPPVRPSPIPLSTAPTSLPPPKQAPVMPAGPTPACPQCEAPMAWVEEHLRFYCKQCRMYF